MSDGYTSILDVLDDVASSDDEDIDDDAVLEWDYSADALVESPLSPTSAYELMEYIVTEFVPANKKKHAEHRINVWKSGKGTFIESITGSKSAVILFCI